eukprot:Pgem_evm1s1805
MAADKLKWVDKKTHCIKCKKLKSMCKCAKCGNCNSPWHTTNSTKCRACLTCHKLKCECPATSPNEPEKAHFGFAFMAAKEENYEDM